MAKKTRTMAATLKAGKKFVGSKKRTSTIDATLATASAGFKAKKKATKTRTMAATLKDAAPPKSKKVAKKAPKRVQKKKAAKAPAKKSNKRAAKKK